MALVLIEATKHFSLILALLYLYALLLPRLPIQHHGYRTAVLQGVLFGLVAVVSMTISGTIAAGYYGDSRSIIVATAAATAGPIPGFIAAVFATLARSFYPLDGFMNGTVSVVMAAVLGAFFYRLERDRRIRGRVRDLLVAGAILALGKLVVLLVFGQDNRFELFELVFVPSLVLFPTGLTLSVLLVRHEKRQYDEARRSAEQRQQFDAAMQTSASGTLIYRTADQCCLYANERAASALASTSKALVGGRIDWLLAALERTCPTFLSQDIIEDQAVELTLPSGAHRWYLVSRRPVRFDDRDCQLLALQDISDQRETQRRSEAQRLALAVEQQRVRSLHEFIRTTSHDLRTPLTVINTSLYLAKKTGDREQHSAQLQKAEDQVSLLSGMLDGIQQWVQLSNLDRLTRTPLDINTLLSSLCDRMAVQAGTHHLTLTLALADEQPMVIASSAELGSALQAILMNALKYTPPGGRITVRTYADGDDVAVEVTDTGIGIAGANLENVFEPFYKADPARNGDHGGIGLGLTIARRVAELHDGSVLLANNADGGLTVRFQLPSATRVLQPVMV